MYKIMKVKLMNVQCVFVHHICADILSVCVSRSLKKAALIISILIIQPPFNVKQKVVTIMIEIKPGNRNKNKSG